MNGKSGNKPTNMKEVKQYLIKEMNKYAAMIQQIEL